MPPFKKQSATQVKLEILFRKHRFYKRMLKGELTARVMSEGEPDPANGQPPGTKSQMVAYFDGHTQVALVHQYLRPDGRQGGRSKHPTPKKLVIGDTIYTMKRSRRRGRSN